MKCTKLQFIIFHFCLINTVQCSTVQLLDFWRKVNAGKKQNCPSLKPPRFSLFSSNYKTSAGKHMWLQHLDFSGNCEGFWYWGLFQRAFGSESYCDNEQRDIVHWPRQCSVLLGWLSYQSWHICQCSASQTCYLSRQTTRIATRPNMLCVILMTNTTGEQTRNGTTELQKNSHAMLPGWLS